MQSFPVTIPKKAGEALRQEGQKIFEAAAKELFEAHPALQNFAWLQYTPYFNDGDPCYFRINEDCISVNGISDDDLEYVSGKGYVYDDVEEFEGIDDPSKLMDEISKLICSVDQDCLERYGEGRVVVHRDGTVEIEDYDHD